MLKANSQQLLFHYHIIGLSHYHIKFWARPLRGQAIRLYLFMARYSPVPEPVEGPQRAIKRIPLLSFALVRDTGMFPSLQA